MPSGPCFEHARRRATEHLERKRVNGHTCYYFSRWARVDGRCRRVWQNIFASVLERENVSLESLCYDGTNFYTFIDTFNTRCELPRRGKNKQGRGNLHQVSYAVFCCEDGQLPVFYDHTLR